MRCERRYMHGKRLRRSPIQYDFTKKKEFGEGKYGKALVDAITPKSKLDVVPLGSKALKAGKTLYNFFKG